MSKNDLNKMDIYPLAHVYIGDGNFTNGQSVNFNVTISSATQININKEINTDKFYGNDNEVDCYNETLSVLNRLWTTMYRDFQEHGIYASENPSLTKSKGDENTLVGWQLDFQVVMPNRTLSLCSDSNKYVLDLISVRAAAAYGLRRLYASWTGSAIRVRRSSDDAEADIGFTANGDLNTTALLAFCGSGDGFVTTWYDQSVNGHHATQTTAANQPQIVSNGAIITEGGRPLISFDGLTQFINLPSSGAPTQNSSLIGVFQTTSAALTAAGFINIMADLVPEKHEIRLGVGTGGSVTTYRAYWNGVYVSLDNPALNFQNLSVFNASFVDSGGVTTTTVRVNGSNALSESAAGTWGDTVEFTIGRFVRINTMRAGIAQELISIQSSLSTTDRQTLERNQGIYFNISVS
jgi:hypothetical protein